MSKVMNNAVVRPMVAALLAVQGWVFQAAAFAQDPPKNVNVDVDVKGPGATGAWYGNWWIWAIAVAVFLIIIVALTNRGGTREVRDV